MKSASTAAVLPSVPQLTDADFILFRDFFYQQTGIWFNEAKRYFVDKRLSERMDEGRYPTFRSYFFHLRTSHSELQQLINLMTVNETYFFRADNQLSSLVEDLMPQIARHHLRTKPIRLWSFPCSTGEEPYSMALFLLEFWKEIDNFDVEIVGSDIDTRVLESARAGRYNKRSLQYVPPSIRDRYFASAPNAEYQLSDDIRGAVRFEQANLNDPIKLRQFGTFDIIFCRNLLIYFDDASRDRAAETLFDALNPGGFLVLGAAESISRSSSLFKICRSKDNLYYQRPR